MCVSVGERETARRRQMRWRAFSREQREISVWLIRPGVNEGRGLICRRRSLGRCVKRRKGSKREFERRRYVFTSTLYRLLCVLQDAMTGTHDLSLLICVPVAVHQTPCCQLRSMWPSERLRSTLPWSRGKSWRGTPSLDSPSPNRYLEKHFCWRIYKQKGSYGRNVWQADLARSPTRSTGAAAAGVTVARLIKPLAPECSI